MSHLDRFRGGLTDDSLRFAILAGLVSIPLTLALSLESLSNGTVVAGGTASGLPLLVAGVVVGYHYVSRPTEGRRPAVWTGLVGSVGPLAVFVANGVSTLSTGSTRLAAIAVLLTPVTAAVGVGLSVLVTTVGGVVGDRVGRRVHRGGSSRTSPDAADHNPTTSSRWKPIVAYAVAAPLILGYALWIRPESGASFALSWLLLVGLLALSVVTLLALFRETTTRRAAETDWSPTPWAYVGGPITAYVLVYAGATLRASANPSGDGVYGFLAALWLASTSYLILRHRYTGTP